MRIRITREGLQGAAPGAERSRLREQFARGHHLRLPGFVEPSLLRLLAREIERSEFYERSHEGIGSNKELCMRNRSTAGGLLHLLLNGTGLFSLVEEIAGCAAIGCFQGRVYRMTPGYGHHDAWHSDVGEHRLVAMSINLSRVPYQGGVLQIRHRNSSRILREVPNTGFGDAILFRIAADLEHRITDVAGAVSKTAFAGWFQSEPTFRSVLSQARPSPWASPPRGEDR
jgi:hypothetical protein